MLAKPAGDSVAALVGEPPETQMPLHRDLRPENVVLQDHAFPVIIDFGLACVRSVPGGTPLDDKYTAPEVKGANPKWTAAADVFALAKTLEALVSSAARQTKDGKSLIKSLGVFSDFDADRRQSAQDLGAHLAKLEAEIAVVAREDSLRDGLLKLVAGNQDLEWIIRDGCPLQISGFALGLYDSERERLCAAAFIINKFAERSLPPTGREATSVARFAARPWPPAVDAIVNLRNEFTHPNPTRRPFTKAQVVEGARLVRDWTEAAKLPDLIERLLANAA